MTVLRPLIALAVLGLFALPVAATVEEADGHYTFTGYRYGDGRIVGEGYLSVDANGEAEFAMVSKQPTFFVEEYWGSVEETTRGGFIFTGSRQALEGGAIQAFEQRPTVTKPVDTISLAINLRRRTVRGMFHQRCARPVGTRFRGHLVGKRSVTFDGQGTERMRAAATAPVGAVGYFLDKDYPADVRALDAELATTRPSEHSGTALGKLVVFVPGMFNRAPSPGVVFRAAKHTERVLIAYSNGRHPEQNTVRRVRALEGVPVPAELEGKILAIGSPEPTVSSWLHTSDLLLEQLEELRQHQYLLGFPLLGAQATVIGHCQGGLAAVHVEQRLQAMGYNDVIGRKAALATPAKGLDYTGAQTLAAIVNPGGESVHAAISDLTGKRVGEVLVPPPHRAWFDVGVSGQRPGAEGDGLVSLESAGYGAKVFRNAGNLDHGQIFRRSSVIDLVLSALPSR